MDLPLQRIFYLILEKVFIPLPPSGIEKIPMILTASPGIRESKIINGTLTLSLINSQTLRIRNIASLHPSVLPVMTIDVPLPRQLEFFPIGRKVLPLVQQLSSTFVRQVCKHSWQSFVTFDQIPYKYNLPTAKCDHVLVQTRSSFKPYLRVAIRKEEKQMRIVKFLIDDIMVEITPVQPTQPPKIAVRFIAVNIYSRLL